MNNLPIEDETPLGIRHIVLPKKGNPMKVDHTIHLEIEDCDFYLTKEDLRPLYVFLKKLFADEETTPWIPWYPMYQWPDPWTNPTWTATSATTAAANNEWRKGLSVVAVYGEQING